MAGIYIHIPFCHRACSYCDFHFSTSQKNKKDILSALIQEMQLRKNFFNTEDIETLYIGGGTPSILEPQEINELIDNTTNIFRVKNSSEITIEANPEDITKENAEYWHKCGINRISLGIQSLDEKSLQFLNRMHSKETALNSIEILRDAGFKNISVDVITGIPNLENKKLIENLELLIEKKPEHFSVYSLTIENKTLLGYKSRLGKLIINEDHSADQYVMASKLLKDNSYFAYEVSNFASGVDYISKHNSSYWRMKPYLGIGPSAHSFDGKNRFRNHANNAQYFKTISEGKLYGETEILSDSEKFNDALITGLRTSWGVSVKLLEQYLNEDQKLTFKKIIEKLSNSENLQVENEWIKIPAEKFIISDSILVKLML